MKGKIINRIEFLNDQQDVIQSWKDCVEIKFYTDDQIFSMFRRINFYPTSENPTKDTHAFISIYGTEFDDQPAPKVNHPLWMDEIQLMFDDVDHDYAPKNLKAISEKQADIIVGFVRRAFQVLL